MKYKILDFIASDSDEVITHIASAGSYLFLNQQKSQFTQPPEL